MVVASRVVRVPFRPFEFVPLIVGKVTLQEKSSIVVYELDKLTSIRN